MGNLEQDKSEEKKKISERINAMFRNYNKLTEHYKYSKSRDKSITILLNMMNTVLTNSMPASSLHDPTYKSMQSMLDNLNNLITSGLEQHSHDIEFKGQSQHPNTENLYKIVQSHSKQLRSLEDSNAYLSEILQLKEAEIRKLKTSIDKNLGVYSQEKIIHSKEESISIESHETEQPKEITVLKSQVANLQSENQDLQAALSSKNSEIIKLKAEIVTLEKEIIDLKNASHSNNEADSGKFDNANSRIKEFETEIENFKSQKIELENMITKLKSENKVLEKELTETKQTSSLNIEEYNNKLTIATSKIQELENELGKYKSKILDFDRIKIDFENLKASNIEIEPGIFI